MKSYALFPHYKRSTRAVQDEQDRYLLDINLEDLETSTGEDQYYWLIAILAARADRILRKRQQDSVTG